MLHKSKGLNGNTELKQTERDPPDSTALVLLYMHYSKLVNIVHTKERKRLVACVHAVSMQRYELRNISEPHQQHRSNESIIVTCITNVPCISWRTGTCEVCTSCSFCAGTAIDARVTEAMQL